MTTDKAAAPVGEVIAGFGRVADTLKAERAAAPVGAVPQGDDHDDDCMAQGAPLSSMLFADIDCAPWVISAVQKMEAALASQAARMGAVSAKWRTRADALGVKSDALRSSGKHAMARRLEANACYLITCADELDAAIDKLRGEAG